MNTIIIKTGNKKVELNYSAKNCYSMSEKKLAVKRLKGDYSVASFEKVAKKTGCCLSSLRRWAKELGSYKASKGKVSKGSKNDELMTMDQLQAMRKEVEVLEVLAKRIEMTKDMIKRLEGSLALDVGNYGKQIAKMRKLVA